jgi:hypothetical protein
VRLAAVVLCLAALAGCGGSGDGGDASSFEQHVVDPAGFAVSVPGDWRTLDSLEDEDIDEFAEENPDFEPFLRFIKETDALQFIALDPDIKDEFATNLNVLVTELPSSVDFDRWIDQNVQTIRGIPSATVGRATREELPAGRAVHLEWSYEQRQEGAERRVNADQYYLRNGNRVFVLTYTTLPDQAASYRETFARSARSFEVR